MATPEEQVRAIMAAADAAIVGSVYTLHASTTTTSIETERVDPRDGDRVTKGKEHVTITWTLRRRLTDDEVGAMNE